MNLLLVGGTREPVRILQYLRLLVETTGDAEALIKTALSGAGVKTSPAVGHFQYVNSIFVLQGCGCLQLDYLKETWGGTFISRPLKEGEEIGDVLWIVDWKTLFENIDNVLRSASLHGERGKFSGVNVNIANGVLTLIVETFVGANIIFEDFVMAHHGDSGMFKRCNQCARFCGEPTQQGQCKHYQYLTGDERICKKFVPREPT